MNASNLVEYVGKTVMVRTKQYYVSKGVVHTVDPVTKRYVTSWVIYQWCKLVLVIFIKHQVRVDQI